MNQKIIAILIFWFTLYSNSFSQVSPEEKEDTAKIYRNIETISKKNKYTKFIHSLIFKPVSPVPKEKKKTKKKVNKNFRVAEKKIIRNIDIITIDPFGLNINDTSIKATNFFAKAGNKVHVTSRKLTVKNLLLFKINDPFDSLIIKESERLIRSQNYVRDVNIVVRLTNTKPDSVNISVFVQDLWSIKFNGNISGSQSGVNITDRNFAGLGYQLQHAIVIYNDKRDPAFETNYFIKNIRNSFINSNIQYKVNSDNYLMRFNIDRPFYSSFARWAGGILFDQQFHVDSAVSINNNFEYQNIKLNTQDYWIGKAWQIKPGDNEYLRSTNFVLAGRFARQRYIERPNINIITPLLFSNEKLLLLSAGINTRIYLQDKFIFNYGVTEDVPTGKVYSLTAGFQNKGGFSRGYGGFKVSWGDYYDWGYFSNSIEYGTFFRNRILEQGTIKQEILYFTNLIPLGRWNFRQFIKPSIVLGLHRISDDRIYIRADSISLNILVNENELIWTGQHRFAINLQTQSYAPWNVFGFRFGPYAALSFVILTQKGFKSNRLFTQFDLGILIKNEFLLFNYFQLSLSFNPVLPGGKYNEFRANAYQTYDFGFTGFDIGKPAVVKYQ